MRKTMTATILAAALTAGSVVTLATASATEDHGDKKVTICHAAGKAGTTKYVTLTISKHAVYKDQGGHFYENGTPQAGHEQDYFGACKTNGTTTTTAPPTTTTQPPTTTTTAPPPPLVCTGDPAVDPIGCPIDDCNLPGGKPPECDEPELIPPVVIIVPAPPAVPVPDESPALAG